MTPVDTNKSSKLLDYLPAIYHEHQFLNDYLSAFEKLLLGRNDGIKIPGVKEESKPCSLKDLTPLDNPQCYGLEETIDAIPALFNPLDTPQDFLPWLASWVALSLRADLDVGEQRNFIASMIQRYRRRGTKENLIELLRIFTQTPPEIDEDAVPSADFIKRYPQFEKDPRPAHFFKVSVLLRDPKVETVQRKREIAHAIIQLEKPAHTFYELETRFSSMRITENFDDRDKYPNKYRATLGVDTLINVFKNVDPKELQK